MVSALSLPHRMWRLLPAEARRRALARVCLAVAPRPDRIEPVTPAGMGAIAIGGEFSVPSGLGESARLLATACERAGIEVRRVEMRVGYKPAITLPPGVPLVLNINPGQVPATLLRAGRELLRDRLVIGYFPCELPVPPPSWRAGTGFVHRIWAPSRFAKAAFEGWLPGRVGLVPHPVAVAPPKASTLRRSDFGWPEDAVVVLVSFSLASSLERKNPLAAIAAFRKAFGVRTDRWLVVKAGHADHHASDLQILREAVGDAPNIRLETRVLPREDAHAMTRAADIVLSLHRSEGFGLVPAEAMLLERAVVATDWSGTTDFLDARCGVPVPYRLVPARDPRGVFEAPGAVWAEADTDAAAAALIRLADDPSLRRVFGVAAGVQARARLGDCALLDALRDIGVENTHMGAA